MHTTCTPHNFVCVHVSEFTLVFLHVLLGVLKKKKTFYVTYLHSPLFVHVHRTYLSVYICLPESPSTCMYFILYFSMSCIAPVYTRVIIYIYELHSYSQISKGAQPDLQITAFLFITFTFETLYLWITIDHPLPFFTK